MRKMSRKPRTFAVLLLMAAFLMVNVAVAGAAININWLSNLNNVPRNGYVSGVVYNTDPVAADVYATVYATIYGQTQTLFVGKYVYGNGTTGQRFDLGLNAISGLIVGTSYDVDFKIHYGDSPNALNNTTTVTKSVYVTKSVNRDGDGGGGVVTPTPPVPPATPPAITAALGTAVPVLATNGATIGNNDAGITITIPAGALATDVKVTISKVADTAGLKMDAGSKLLGDVLEIIKDKSGDFSKPVTIQLNFDKSKIDATKFDVKVCFYDEEAGQWVPLDKISVGDGKVSGEVTHFTKFAVIAFPKAETATPAGLKDISGHWAEANIKTLVGAGAISGYPDGTFKPNATITRAEFATILAKAFKLAPSTSKVFADTANHWAKDSISAAAAAGIVNGYSAAQFGPNDQITREQMAVMIAKAAKLAEAKNGKAFADKAQVSAWAAAAVASASENGIISGYPDNTFKPKATATRAEAVTVIVKALK